MGVCLDTCHLWASGVDITDSGRVDALMSEVDERFGPDRLHSLHVNDSALPLGAMRDRHAEVGEGLIGKGMAVMLGHPAVQDLAAIMETPGPNKKGPDESSVRALRRVHRAGVRRWATERAGA
jgi:deoxyribonuclease-4